MNAKRSRKRKLLKLSDDLELAILHGILRGTVAKDAVEPEELSKLGRFVHASLVALDKPTLAGVLLHATEVFGGPKDQLKAYLQQVSMAGSGVEMADILRKVRDKQVLVDLINEAGSQLQRGTLDLALIGGLITTEAGATHVLESISETVRGGLPPEPIGLELRSLPTLAKHSGGVYGLWAVGGEPGVGKSTLAWQLALDVGRHTPVLYYDFENGFPALMRNTREIFGGDLERIRQATGRIYYRDSIRSIDSDLARVPAPALLVIDSVQKLPGSVEHRRTSLDKWVHRLEYLKKRGYTVLLVSEVGRAAYNSDAYIGSYKETGEIEYSADLGLQLLPGSGESVEVHIVKNRHRPYKGLSCVLKRKNGWFFKEITGEAPEAAEID